HTRFSRDWSSDVCSSDLATREHHQPEDKPQTQPAHKCAITTQDFADCGSRENPRFTPLEDQQKNKANSDCRYVGFADLPPPAIEIGRASCRERVLICGVA